MVPQKTVYLVRHAESEGNAGARTFGPQGIVLTDKGRQQANNVSDFFRRMSEPPKLIVVSPFIRTRETARPLAEALLEAKIEEWPVQEFTYLCTEKCRNTTQDERAGIRDAYWEKLDPNEIDGKGTESFSMFFDRIDDFFSRLRTTTYNPIAVFTHGEFIRITILRAMLPSVNMDINAMKQFRQLKHQLIVPNASITRILIESNAMSVGQISIDHIPFELRS